VAGAGDQVFRWDREVGNRGRGRGRGGGAFFDAMVVDIVHD